LPHRQFATGPPARTFEAIYRGSTGLKSLPEEIIHRIETTTELDRLDACVDQIMDIQSLEELRL
jgi:hypothetical protein